MKLTACVWCSSIVKVGDHYDDLLHVAVCCQSCRDAENLFRLHYSDEEISRRAHYRDLTKGDDDGEDT